MLSAASALSSQSEKEDLIGKEKTVYISVKKKILSMNDLNRVHRFWILFTGTRTTFSSEISSVSSDIIHSHLMDVGWVLVFPLLSGLSMGPNPS